jgi:hypothetical protein
MSMISAVRYHDISCGHRVFVHKGARDFTVTIVGSSFIARLRISMTSGA